MKTTFLPLVLLLAFNAYAGVFLETISGSDKIFRGRAPKSFEIKKLVEKDINTVIIFKNQTTTEVDQEISLLSANGFAKKNIHHIAFQWKDIKSEKLACEQVLHALDILMRVHNSERDRVLFHCTVGEDRTGLLAGLATQLLTNKTSKSIMQTEMCNKGYGAGNKNKPAHVSQAVDKFLTPLYYKISALIENGKITSDNINKSACRELSNIQTAESYFTCYDQ